MAVSKRARWIVAGRAGDGSVSRQARIVEEPAPERDSLSGERIVLGHRHIQIQTERNADQRGDQQDRACGHGLTRAAGRREKVLERPDLCSVRSR